MSQENSVAGLIVKLEKLLEQRYTRIFINSRFCFMKPTGEVFSVQQFLGEDAIVVEYADSCAEAALNRFEDGDRHYPVGMTEETLIQSILREIEQ